MNLAFILVKKLNSDKRLLHKDSCVAPYNLIRNQIHSFKGHLFYAKLCQIAAIFRLQEDLRFIFFYNE